MWSTAQGIQGGVSSCSFYLRGIVSGSVLNPRVSSPSHPPTCPPAADRRGHHWTCCRLSIFLFIVFVPCRPAHTRSTSLSGGQPSVVEPIDWTSVDCRGLPRDGSKDASLAPIRQPSQTTHCQPTLPRCGAGRRDIEPLSWASLGPGPGPGPRACLTPVAPSDERHPASGRFEAFVTTRLRAPGGQTAVGVAQRWR